MAPSWTDELGLDELEADDPDRRVRLERGELGLALSPGVLEPASGVDPIEPVLMSAPYALEALSPPAVHALSADPRVVLVSMADATEHARTGAVRVEFAGEWLLDGRHEAAGVLLASADARVAVVVVDGEARVYDLSVARSVSGEPGPVVPDVAAFAGGFPLEGWLVDRLEPLERAGGVYQQAAALGTLARLWAPQDVASELRRLMRGELSAPGRIRAWAMTLDDPVRQGLVEGARRDVGACHERLDELRSAAVEASDESAREALRGLVERRDVIESVRWLLAAGRGSVAELDDVLREVDERARDSWRDRPRPSGLEEVIWLGELAARDPYAWWARR